MSSPKELVNPTVSPSACLMFQVLAERLHQLQELLSVPLFSAAWQSLAQHLNQACGKFMSQFLTCSRPQCKTFPIHLDSQTLIALLLNKFHHNYHYHQYNYKNKVRNYLIIPRKLRVITQCYISLYIIRVGKLTQVPVPNTKHDPCAKSDA
jgi:hypothetical protein